MSLLRQEPTAPPSAPAPLGGEAIAVQGSHRGWTPAELADEARRLAAHLQAAGVRVLATLADNTPAWVVADLAAAQAGIVHVPLPSFFTPAQWMHVVASAGVNALLTPPLLAERLPFARPAQSDLLTIAEEPFCLLPLATAPVPLPPGTAKITFTSGTTGTPKGVCLSHDAMQRVAQGLADALGPLGVQRHLCALPFPVLLENIAGLMAPRLRNATCIVLPLAEVGLTGSSSFDPAVLQAAVAQHRPHSVILLPQMLRAWAAYLQHTGQRAPSSLKVAAVGGAAVGARSVALARAVGIPAFEGYGLSEGASVQALNLPHADRPGSAGRALPHARLRCTPEGELEVAGSLFLGYLGEPVTEPGAWWPTGDIGHIDADGFVHVQGRKKNVLITGFGRNVAPEWVETALRGEHEVMQAVVLGDGQPQLSAVLWPSAPGLTDATLQAAVDAANTTLPDYARIGRWARALAPFSAEAGLATPNGRPLRPAVERMHAHALGLAPANPTAWA